MNWLIRFYRWWKVCQDKEIYISYRIITKNDKALDPFLIRTTGYFLDENNLLMHGIDSFNEQLILISSLLKLKIELPIFSRPIMAVADITKLKDRKGIEVRKYDLYLRFVRISPEEKDRIRTYLKTIKQRDR